MIQETIQWNSVATPNELTTGLAVLIVGLLALFLYAGIRLRSIVTLGGFMFSVVTLISALLFDMNLRFFLIVISITSVMVFFSTVVATIYGESV